MTIQEAMATGKPFRRKGTDKWIVMLGGGRVHGGKGGGHWYYEDSQKIFPQDAIGIDQIDFVAADWETKP